MTSPSDKPGFYQGLARIGRDKSEWHKIGTEKEEREKAKFKRERDDYAAGKMPPRKVKSEKSYQRDLHVDLPIRISIQWSIENAEFILALAGQYERDNSYIANRLLEAARYGVPYYIPHGRNKLTEYALWSQRQRADFENAAVRLRAILQLNMEDKKAIAEQKIQLGQPKSAAVIALEKRRRLRERARYRLKLKARRRAERVAELERRRKEREANWKALEAARKLREEAKK